MCMHILYIYISIYIYTHRSFTMDPQAQICKSVGSDRPFWSKSFLLPAESARTTIGA